MADKKVVIIAPSPYSLYTTTVYQSLVRKNIDVVGVIVKKFTFSRFISEYKRDGSRLVKKIWKKLILKDKAYQGSPIYNIVDYRKENAIDLQSLDKLSDCEIIKCEDINSPVVEKFIRKLHPDLIIFTGGGLIRENIFAVAGKGVLNCHMGILPNYRGMDVVEWPILCDEPDEVGITVHIMDKGVDTGPILGVQKIDVTGMGSFQQLRQKFEPVMCDFLVDVSIKYLNNEIVAVNQSLESGKQYFQLHPTLYREAEKKLLKYAKLK